MEKDVDIHISSLSKGLGCFGGYVASSNMLRDLFVNRSQAVYLYFGDPWTLVRLCN